MREKLPVLLVIFNRPDSTFQVLQPIIKYQPSKLFISSDGGRTAKEKLSINTLRNDVLRMINWNCEVFTLFHDDNQGCEMGVFSGINWFFNHVDKGVIIEDDCIVNESFFVFMEELLERFEYDQRIGMIAGHNSLEMFEFSESYCFSKYAACWGWATWKRAWLNMNIKMSWKHDANYVAILKNRGFKSLEVKHWKYQIKCIDSNYVSAWDWQWYFSLAANNQLCIFPNKNLVSNIGNDKNATHTQNYNKILSSYQLKFPLIHPYYIVPNPSFDYQFYKLNNSLKNRIKRVIPISIKRMLKKHINRF